jgi:hypothetical protein
LHRQPYGRGARKAGMIEAMFGELMVAPEPVRGLMPPNVADERGAVSAALERVYDLTVVLSVCRLWRLFL